jgi:3-phosphoshikimate 1-carboxyvinyltransferase
MPTVHDLIVKPQARALVGIVPVAADDQVAHLALLLSALTRGTCEVRGAGSGPAVTAVSRAIRQLGVSAEEVRPGSWRVRGAGLRGLTPSPARVDVGPSVAALHALAGVLVAQPFASELVGSDAVMHRDVSPLAGALRMRGARVEGLFSPSEVGAITPPLSIGALELPHLLGETEHALPLPDPHLKAALLLSGLYADGDTYVSEPLVSRDHAERMLQALDAPLSTVGSMVHLESVGWGAELPSFQMDVPGDFFGAALILAAALLVPRSRVGARDVDLNRRCTGFLELARHMGAPFDVEVHGDALGEPVGVASTEHAALSARTMEGEMLGRAASEVPMLLALAARARGDSLVGDWGASAAPPPAILIAVLRSFGVECEPSEGGIALRGQPEGALRAAEIACADESDAALALLLALLADGPSRLLSIDPLARRFPRLVGTLRALGADLHVERRTE